ncbi:LacI family DNA-binding transcriptional regulator [Haloimpatiens sp. FM7330]|uniref:LacI family DNA-binding transcriptional regulator n=1 Tax=Haloimpatiens sp. FM7330 TaxID=3298610 RepID=UPI0036303EA9
MAVTIRDIAKRSGVSLATVSRVLNDSGYVKDETRKKVMDAIKELNYTPSAIARSLTKKKTNIIGVLVPDINNPYFGELIKGISNSIDEANFNMILCDTDENMKKEVKALKLLREQRSEGIIITPTSAEDTFNSEYLSVLENLGIPIVLVAGDVKYSSFNGVFVDNIKGAFEATQALIKEGHQKIGIITGRLNSKPAKDRLMGYKKALTINDIPIDEKNIYYGDYRLESGYKCAKQLLKMENRPTAVFTCGYLMTLGTIKAIYEEGMKIPEDISLISFDKVEVLSMLGQNISYVAEDTVEMGKIAVKMLLDNLSSKESEEVKRITLAPKLVLNGSEKYASKNRKINNI